jgi:hypothetical protein
LAGAHFPGRTAISCFFYSISCFLTFQQDESKKKKKNKVKPILHNREEHSPLSEEEPIAANHFEEILPKDDALLKKSISVSHITYLHQLYFADKLHFE